MSYRMLGLICEPPEVEVDGDCVVPSVPSGGETPATPSGGATPGGQGGGLIAELTNKQPEPEPESESPSWWSQRSDPEKYAMVGGGVVAVLLIGWMFMGGSSVPDPEFYPNRGRRR